MKVKRTKINEETAEQAVEKELAKDVEQHVDNVEEVDHKGDIEVALDRALATALRLKKYGKTSGFMNVLLRGEAGTGKTARVEQWANGRNYLHKNLNVVIKSLGTMDNTDLGGAPVADLANHKAIKLTTTELDALDEPGSILFLDEYNRADAPIRGTVLTLINNHRVPDAFGKNGQRYFENMLFTVVAMNPNTADYNVSGDMMDFAERSRFANVDVKFDKTALLAWFNREWPKLIAKADAEKDEEAKGIFEGQLKLAQTLLGNRAFRFDDAADREQGNEDYGEDYQPLMPRSFENLINACDGTKADLLANWNIFCNQNKKAMAERILADYVDVNDKANAALAGGTKSKVINQESPLDKLKAARAKAA